VIAFTLHLEFLRLFFLVFVRVVSVVGTLPVLDTRGVPGLFKAGLSLGMSAALVSVVPLSPPSLSGWLPFGLAVAGEVLLGVLMGLSIRLLFTGIQMAGQLVGFQMGFAVANVFDPVTSAQVSLPAQAYNLFATLIFLTVNGHHQLLRALAESFRRLPPSAGLWADRTGEPLTALAGEMFSLSIRVGAPVLVALLLTSIALGIVARTVPQMNVYFVAMPVSIAVGLIFMALSFPFVWLVLADRFADLGRTLLAVLRPFS
jgi:flagellar biosynthetic protein FliR